METIQQEHVKYWKTVLALFAGGFITFAILYATQPLLPVFSKEFHVSPALSSLSLSVSTITLAISMLITSSVSESFGRKTIMGLSLTLSSLLAILTAFSQQFCLLLVLRALQGIVLAGLPAIAMAYVSEEFPPARLGGAMGMYVSGTGLGGMTGRIIIGLLTDHFSWHIALGTVGIISLLLSLWFWFTLPKSEHFIPKPSGLGKMMKTLFVNLRSPILILLYLVGFAVMGSFVTLFNYIGYLLMAEPYHLSQSAVGWIFLVYITGIFSSTWMGRQADQYGKPRVLLLGVTLMLFGGWVTLFPNLISIIIGSAMLTFGFFGSHAVASSWVGQKAVSGRAQASSLYLLFYYAGSSIAGATGGILWSFAGWPGVIALISTLLIGALFFALFAKRLNAYS